MSKIYRQKQQSDFFKARKTAFCSKFIIKIIICALLFCFAAAIFTACGDDDVLQEGTIVDKFYGNPIYEERGSFGFIIVGEEDYFIKVENGDDWQWFRVVDLGVYRDISVGDWFAYNNQHYIPVKSFLDGGNF